MWHAQIITLTCLHHGIYAYICLPGFDDISVICWLWPVILISASLFMCVGLVCPLLGHQTKSPSIGGHHQSVS